MTPFSLSLTDLLLVEGFQEAFGKDDKETIHKILFNNGMETKYGVEEVVCKHRNLRNQVVECLRYEASERQDPRWLNTGAASWEVQLDSCEDVYLRDELLSLGKQKNFTGDILEHISNGQSKE